MITLPNLCMSCAHLDKVDTDGESNPTCRAFPLGIPVGIWQGGGQHFDPEFDGAIVYELATGAEQALAGYLEYWYELADTEDPRVPGPIPDFQGEREGV